MKFSIKLLAAVLALGLPSAYADSGTDRYMAGGAANVQGSGEGGPAMSANQSLFNAMCYMPGQPNCHDRPAPACAGRPCSDANPCSSNLDPTGSCECQKKDGPYVGRCVHPGHGS